MRFCAPVSDLDLYDVHVTLHPEIKPYPLRAVNKCLSDVALKYPDPKRYQSKSPESRTTSQLSTSSSTSQADHTRNTVKQLQPDATTYND